MLNGLGTLKDLEYGIKNVLVNSSEVKKPYSDGNDLTELLSITGLETFSLSYKVCFVLVLLGYLSALAY